MVREKIPGIPLSNVNTSDLEKQRRREEAFRKASEAEGKRHARQKEKFQTELMKRRELAKNFLPGDEVETGGRIGRVAESSKIDFERGNVPVLLGRGEAVPYNPMVLRNLSKEKRERGE